jgi:PKHD-type hydroxylase
MNLENKYYYFKSVISPDICEKIISLGKEKMQKELDSGNSIDATTFGDNHKSGKPNAKPQKDLTIQQSLKKKNKKDKELYVRDSKISWLNEPWLYELFLPYIQKANEEAGWKWHIDYTENFQFTQYENDQFYGWHADSGTNDHLGIYRRYIYGVTKQPLKSNGTIPSNYVVDNNMVGKIRKISMTVNLCPPGSYDGGNLKFDFGEHVENRFHECEEIRPQGSIIIFPSFMYHCVTPVTRGTRYSLVSWTLGEPYR